MWFLEYQFVHFVILLLNISFAIIINADEDNVKNIHVTISQGVLEGKIRYTTKSLAFHTRPIRYYSFEGIPFAQPPIGNLRFKNPLPARNWSGIYDATQVKLKCPQITENFEVFEGDEDCLYLNVYTRDFKRKSLRPVFVNVHGGRYRFGAGSFRNPSDLLLEIDPIIVTFNYRLDILGLLSLNTEYAPGNLQNKDQILALRWVNKNIEYFGGDPNNVALFGSSSGGSSINLLQSSPMAKGLFHKTIIISGTSLCNWFSGYEPVALVKDFGKFLQLKTNNTIEIYQHLMEQPANELIQKSFDFEFKNNFKFNKFSSILEKTFEDVENFLPRTPSSAYKSGFFNDVPMLISYSSMEYAFYINDNQLEEYTKHDDMFIPHTWKIPLESKLFNDTIKKIKEFYFGDSINIDLINNREHLISFTLLMGDILFFQPVSEFLKMHSNNANSPLYIYRFSYRGGLNNPKIEKYGFQGATHSDDKKYIFPNNNNTLDLFSSDNITRRRFLTLYRNFLETSNPTPGPYTHTLPFKWLPYTDKRKDYLSISGDAIMSQDPDGRRVKFWTDLEEFVIKEKNIDKNWRDSCNME